MENRSDLQADSATNPSRMGEPAAESRPTLKPEVTAGLVVCDVNELRVGRVYGIRLGHAHVKSGLDGAGLELYIPVEAINPRDENVCSLSVPASKIPSMGWDRIPEVWPNEWMTGSRAGDYSPILPTEQEREGELEGSNRTSPHVETDIAPGGMQGPIVTNRIVP